MSPPVKQTVKLTLADRGTILLSAVELVESRSRNRKKGPVGQMGGGNQASPIKGGKVIGNNINSVVTD